ncbi:LuxR C-terminal-related transcriptional regulator [Paenibacillus tundrae]|uniref:LuxR C-terminal-related transcriptional regulator n=1 Tax=Paenibacillus tundrae TaxID=528187 RepID=UPI0030CBBE79
MNSSSQYRVPLSFAQQSVIASRVTIPKQAANHVSRNRLLYKLTDSHRPKVTLISAPAGFGKTTIAAEWARIHSDQVAWVSLETTNNHLVRFWLSLQASIQIIVPTFLDQTELFIQSVRDGSIETAISLLLNELYSFPHNITFVLDDYHVITGLEIHESMHFFIEHLPTHMSIVLLSRTLPPLSLSRMRVQQELLELNSDDLRFTLGEIQELQSYSLSTRLTQEELVLLEQKTEGWVAGLILALLSFTDHQDRIVYLNKLSGNNRNIFDYLLDEVLSRQSESIQSLLLATSILNSFCPSLVAAVMNDSEAKTLLQDIENSRLFIIPLDDTRTWFRYHHLFGDMLHSRLDKQVKPSERAMLHIRAAHWYDKEGLALESIQHALIAEDFALAASCMERHFNTLITSGDESTLLELLDQIPLRHMIVHPDLFYFQAGSMAVSGKLDHANRFLYNVETFMQEENFISAEEKAILHMKLDLYRTSVAFYQGDVDSFVDLLDQNREGIAQFASIVKVVNIGEALLYRGPIGFGGRLKKMAYLSAKVSTSEERRSMLHYALEGHGYIFLSDLYYELNNLEAARKYMEMALATCDATSNLSVWVPGVILQSKILKACGQVAEAEATLRLALEELRQHHAPHWERLLEAAHIRIQISQGVTVHYGDAWLAQRHMSATDKPIVTREYEQITLARVLMARQQLQEAIPWLNKLLSEARRTDRIGSQIEILLLVAEAHEANDERNKAYDALQRAIKLAEPEGYIRIFLDEGIPLMTLLHRWSSDQDADEQDYTGQLNQAYQAESLIQGTDSPEPAAELEIHFTKRERELLQHIVDGLSNDEIAQQLFLSPGTVKRYIHHIYQKLDVKNRVQAVTKINEWNLL